MAFQKFFFIFWGLCIFPFSNIFSQNDSVKTYKLPDVIVSATKTQISPIEAASSVSVITRNEILNSKKIFLYDLLKSEPGISFNQQGGAGMFASVYLRGGNPGHTLILIDGVEINMPNDPANAVDLATLPLDDVKQIEILRGPQSTLYGSDALAGVINIISKKEEKKSATFLQSEVGSYKTFKAAIGTGGNFNLFNYSLSLGKVTTEGFSSASEKFGNTEKDGHNGLNLSAHVGANINEHLNLSILYKHNRAETDYDQFGGMLGDDPTYIFNVEENIFRTEARMNFLDGVIESKAGVSYFKNVRKYSYDSTLNNPSSSTSFYDGKKLKVDLQNNFKITENNIITLGFETEEEEAYTEYFIFSSLYPFESILPSSKSRTSGVFLQTQTNIAGNFFGSAGVRYDHNDLFGSSVTYRIAPAYIFWKTGTKIKASLGTGYKSPSIYYLFDPAFGNQSLKPEKSIGWDAGIEQYFFKSNSNEIGLTVGAVYFQNTFKDLFGFDESFKTININEAETKGLEFYLNADLYNDINLKLNFTLMDTKDLSKGSVDEGKKLLRRPASKGALVINYNLIDPLNLNFETIYVGKRDDRDFSKFPERIELKSYVLLNFAASYNIIDAVQLYSRIENLLDTDYEEVFGYGVPGLSFYSGVRLNF